MKESKEEMKSRDENNGGFPTEGLGEETKNTYETLPFP